MTTQQLYLFNGVYLLALIVVVIFTRAPVEISALAYPGGTD